jgi:hypothetical protein
MKNEHNTVWRCVICNSRTATLHEIVYGRGNRELAIIHNIQAPACTNCHRESHSEEWEAKRNEFITWLDVDRVRLIQAFNAGKRSPKRAYLKEISDHCLRQIKSREVW